VDYNNDGKMDVIAGEYNGKVHLYLNIGTASEPDLTDAGYLQIKGNDITVDAYSKPYMADWNNDGLPDLLVGGADGRIMLLINTGSAGSPVFSSYQYVQNEGIDLEVGGGSAAPYMADVTGDGLPDLVCGEYEGHLRLYQNQGTIGSPQFMGYVYLAYSGEDISFASYSRPFVVDWNNDGGLDLVVGHVMSVPTLYLYDDTSVLLPEFSVTFNGPYTVPAEGGKISFDITVSNPHSQPITLDFYTAAQMSRRGFWGPLMNYQAYTLPPGRTVNASFDQDVPGAAPNGFYDYTTFVGSSADWQFLRMDSFSFMKY
jgi:hypothetical protein